MNQLTIENLRKENEQMKQLLNQFANWPDEMCNWLDAGVRARGRSRILLKKLSEEAMPLKPLSELHKDREACEAIADFMCFNLENVKLGDHETVLINGFFDDDSCELTIWPDGDVFYSIDGEPEQLEGVFHIVKLINGLGYDVQPETKTT